MAFLCPACNAPTLAIHESVDLGPGDYDDERALQRIGCPCGLRGAALYRESRRGAGESWHHDGFELDDAGMATVREHMAKRALPERGLIGLVTFERKFPMRRV